MLSEHINISKSNDHKMVRSIALGKLVRKYITLPVRQMHIKLGNLNNSPHAKEKCCFIAMTLC